MNDTRPGQVRQNANSTSIRIKGLPTIRLRPSRRLPTTTTRSIRIVRRGTGCTVDLVYETTPQAPAETSAAVGIDLGVRKRLTLSSGETVIWETNDWKAIRRGAQAKLERREDHERPLRIVDWPVTAVLDEQLPRRHRLVHKVAPEGTRRQRRDDPGAESPPRCTANTTSRSRNLIQPEPVQQYHQERAQEGDPPR